MADSEHKLEEFRRKYQAALSTIEQQGSGYRTCT